MKLFPIVASRFHADGGTMFGLVPKVLWQQLCEPDEHNQIPQNMNSWLIQTDGGEYGLLDVGCGDPAWLSDKQRAISGIDPRWYLKEALVAHGLGFDQISFVILTHAHWDHAGAIGNVDASGDIRHSFPNADVYMHAREWELATSGDPLLFKAYPEATVAPLRALPATRLKCLDGPDDEVRPGIRMAHTGGHTAGHSCVVFAAGTFELCHPEATSLPPFARALYAGDVCPSQHHLRMVYHLAYDTYPMQTRRWKFDTFPLMAQENDLLLFDHDPELAACLLQTHPQMEVTPSHTLTQITPPILDAPPDKVATHPKRASC